MLEVNSYLKVEEKYIPIQEFTDEIFDSDYIEGAIEIIINNNILLSVDESDYIDQLWSYILDGLIAVDAWTSFSTYFPDSAVNLAFEPDRAAQTVKIVVNSYTEVSSVIPYEEFMQAMVNAATVFFRKLGEVCKDLSEFSDEKLRSLPKLINQ